MSEPTSADYDRIAGHVEAFTAAADAIAEHDIEHTHAILSRHIDATEHPETTLYQIAATGVALIAALVSTHEPACDECGQRCETGEWMFDGSLRAYDDDPAMAAAGNAVAAAANHDAEKTNAILRSYVDRYDGEGLAELVTLLLRLFCQIRKTVPT